MNLSRGKVEKGNKEKVHVIRTNEGKQREKSVDDQRVLELKGKDRERKE